MFENPRSGRQTRNFTTNAPKILDLKSSSEQIFSRKLPLGAPVLLESLSKHNDDNDNVKRRLSLWAKKQICTCITLCRTFLWRSRHDYDVKPPSATFYGGHEHTTTNFPFSFETWIMFLRIQLQEKLPMKERKFIFSATFSLQSSSSSLKQCRIQTLR